jgi:hypothetical protein
MLFINFYLKEVFILLISKLSSKTFVYTFSRDLNIFEDSLKSYYFFYTLILAKN